MRDLIKSKYIPKDVKTVTTLHKNNKLKNLDTDSFNQFNKSTKNIKH